MAGMTTQDYMRGISGMRSMAKEAETVTGRRPNADSSRGETVTS